MIFDKIIFITCCCFLQINLNYLVESIPTKNAVVLTSNRITDCLKKIAYQSSHQGCENNVNKCVYIPKRIFFKQNKTYHCLVPILVKVNEKLKI